MDFLSRFEPLAGKSGIENLKKSYIAIFGLGGVGSYTVEALARSGAGSLFLVDGDKIEISNINRQLFALHSTIGIYKTEAAKYRILDINPDCKVDILSKFILPPPDGEFDASIFPKKPDFIVDAADTVSLKIALAAYADKFSIPIIAAMGCGNRLSAFDFSIDDIYKTSGCPLCRIMRRELRKRNVKGLKVVYSAKPPAVQANPPASAAWVPSVAGLFLAEAVITHFCKLPQK